MKEHLRYFTIITISILIISLLLVLDSISFRNELQQKVYSAFLNVFSFALMFSMITAWGLSVIRRVMQTSIRRYLIFSACAMLFWLFIREIKWHYVESVQVTAILWYLFYVPMIMLPVYAFYAAKHIGKDEAYRLHHGWHIIYAISLLLIVLVLTNSFHQKVFSFGETISVENYSYEIGYYLIALWIVTMTILFIVIAERRFAQGVTGWRRFIPFLFVAIGIAYVVCYINRKNLSWMPRVDLMVAYDWLTIMIWETCIELGLITVNSYYLEFFKRSSIGAQITDYDGNPYISAHNAVLLSRETFDKLLEDETYQFTVETRLHLYPSLCGYTIWQEDVSTVNGMIETLKNLQEELKEVNSLAEQEMQAEIRKKTTEERTRLYTLLSESMENELALINGLSRIILNSSDEKKIRELMATINFEGVYLKRKGNFIMIAETGKSIPWEELELALMELEKNLVLCNMQFSYRISCERDFERKELLELFETIETMAGAWIFKKNAMFVYIDSDSQGTNMTVKLPGIKDSRFRYEREVENNA